MKKLKDLKLIIFDLDGTLVDSGVDITNALNYAISPLGLSSLSVGSAIKLVGEGINRLIDKVLGEADATTKKEVLDRFIGYYTDHLTDYTRPYPGMLKTLEKLGKYKKAVISNKRESLSIKLLKELGLAGYFDVILGSDSVPEKKPSPVPVQKVLSMLGITPGEALIIGDSNFDIMAGREAGITTVAVTYGFRGRETLEGADFIIDTIEELASLTGDEDMQERRKETRYPIPEIYREYIDFRLKDNSGNFVRTDLLDFSRNGIKLRSRFALREDTVLECLISIPSSLRREVAFKIRIRHCGQDNELPAFIAGAEIVEIPSELWFHVIEKIHDFIRDRMGKVF